VTHGGDVDKRSETRHGVDVSRGAGLGGIENRRLQVPQEARGALLAERQQTLACGYKGVDRLLEIDGGGQVFSDAERMAGIAECGGVVRIAAGIFPAFELEEQLEETAAERQARGPAFLGRLARAELLVERDPSRGLRAVCGTAECRFENAGLREIVTQKDGQGIGCKQFFGN